MASFAPEKRIYPRLRPRGLISLAIYQGERIPPAYAILNDISETGACVASDRILARGQSLQLRIQFATQSDLFETGAAVRWIRPHSSKNVGSLTGIQFWPVTVASHRLRKVLAAPNFAIGGRQPEPFEDFLRELKPYLERLGEHLARGSTLR